ncbi:hypothetical protein ACFV27_00665 [Streptomyces antimycoticus]|uniref:hypothetical protein n=1 Tax=Streptomyces antimycoticus TaxID=68175 RepID=UPI003683D28B
MTAETEKTDVLQIADDGVQECPLTHARPLLTRLIADAREKDLVTALTVRKERKIVMVTPEWYEEAQAAMDKRSA